MDPPLSPRVYQWRILEFGPHSGRETGFPSIGQRAPRNKGHRGYIMRLKFELGSLAAFLLALVGIWETRRKGSQGNAAMYTGAAAMALMTGFQRSQDTLYTLSADTGGTAMLDSNDLSG